MRRLFILAFAPCLAAQTAPTGENVLLVVNRNSDMSVRIGEMYAKRRDVPAENVCAIRTGPQETIGRSVYEQEIESVVMRCLDRHPEPARIRYLLTTKGVPLRIRAEGGGRRLQSTAAAVDSELTLVGRRLRGERPGAAGTLPNPYFQRYRETFSPQKHDFYPVTRLTGYTYEDAVALVERAMEAKNRGMFVLDLAPVQPELGNQWLRRAARALPLDRVLLDRRNAVVYDQRGVIGYASWGSNDSQRAVDRKRFLGFEWLPGAVALEYVSTSARTFAEPPKDWTIGSWKDPSSFFDGSPQTMTGDLIREGVTGACGHVYEPFLQGNPRPDYVLPAYFSGLPLAEAFYVGTPYLSWMNVIVGDPLCRLE